MAKTSLQLHFKDSLRLIVTIGKTDIAIAAEELQSYSKLADFCPTPHDLLRADLIILAAKADDLTAAVQKLSLGTHDAGAIYLASSLPKLKQTLEKHGFKTTKIDQLLTKKSIGTPDEYGEDYLKRWGETDFLANAELAAQQILVRAPSEISIENLRVLDVGCLNGYIMESLYRAGVNQIYGTDISYPMAITHNLNQRHLAAIRVGDFSDNTYADDTFDVTICMEVLEHIPSGQTEKFIQELARITRIGGRLLISTSEDWLVDATHINCRNRAEWYCLFAKYNLMPSGSQIIFPGFNSFVLRKTIPSITAKLWQALTILRLALTGCLPSREDAKPQASLKTQLVNRLVPDDTTVGTHNLANREVWLKQTLGKIPRGQSILDAGAGELQYKRFCDHLKYTSQDLGEYDGAGDQAGLHTATWDNSKLDIVSDIVKIPVPDCSFDAVMCIEVFEHIPRPIVAIKEFARILKSGGSLVITVPVSSLTHFAPFYFYNGYSRYFFETILPEFGFTDIKIEYNGNYFESVAQEVRRIDEIAAKYAGNTARPSRWYRLASRVVLRQLANLSQRDQGSHELTSHGLHVTARKR